MLENRLVNSTGKSDFSYRILLPRKIWKLSVSARCCRRWNALRLAVAGLGAVLILLDII